MLEFRILGPIEVVRDGRPLPLGGARQRALLADLTLHPNEVISADRLIDDVWGEEPPDTAAHLLHVSVSRLRKTLEDQGRDVLVTRSPGYTLVLAPPDELDADRFEAYARRGAAELASDPASALETFDLALSWWRGRALEELSEEPFAQPSATRLEELRQAALEHRVEALLALGRNEDAVGEIEALVARFPLRERPRELQMLALYRVGRQADALEAFRVARRTLAEELGVDPGPALVSLEAAILRHDPELGPPAGRAVVDTGAVVETPVVQPRAGPVTAATPGPKAGAASSRAWATLAVVLVGVVALVTAVVFVGARAITDEPSPAPSAAASGIGAITWVEAPDPGETIFGGPGNQVILGGETTPGGAIAVGYSAFGGDYDAAMWTASAVGWQRLDDPTFAAPGNQRATNVAEIPGRTVLVGSDAPYGDHDAAVWTLEDGANAWDRVDPTARGMREPGDQWVRGLMWSGTRLVAVGTSVRGGDADAAIWASRDGLDWTLLTPTNLDVPGDQEMASVAMFGELIVACGFTTSSDGGRDAAVWTSADGSDWELVTARSLGGEGDQQINDVLAGGPGLVAVGQSTVDGDVDAAVWTSRDGVRWSRVGDDGAFGGEGAQQMSAVASSGGLLAAAGTEIVGHEVDGAIWTSRDGIAWTRTPSTSPGMATLADYGRQWIRELLGTPEGFLALGREGRGGGDDADAWIGRPAD